MSQLGFTFYPKDWWTSDSFYTLNPFERYIYLELLFMMYDNEGSIKNDRVKVERRLCTTIKDDVWLKITDLMVEDGDQLTHKSVNKRLKKALANRENGKKGGRPKKDEEKPKKPKLETEEETKKNPPLERERERERERENKEKEGEEKKEIPPTENPLFEKIGNVELKPLSDCKNEVLNDISYLEIISMNLHLSKTGSVDNAAMWVEEFYKHLQNQGTMRKSIQDFKSHFGRWLPIKLQQQNGKEQKNTEPTIAKF